jgi:hemerythrin superfamily protein
VHKYYVIIYNEVQRFVGLVNYVSNFLPNVTAYTGPLTAMTKNGAPFFWRPIHDRCFQMIKAICCKTPVIRPVNYEAEEPIWVICDASKTGVGAMYGQGKDWISCRPAGFMSKKFSSAQQHYAVHEMETLAILEALLKWEDKLIGKRIHVITDHKALEFFKTQIWLSNRQQRWTDYMSRFNFDITYVKGEYNKVADCLSRYYENDTPADEHEYHEYVHADRKLDPDGEDLPQCRVMEIMERKVEIRTMRATKEKRNQQLRDIREQRDAEAEELRDVENNKKDDVTKDTDDAVNLADSLGKAASGKVRQLRKEDDKDDRILLNKIRNGYSDDKLFKLVLGNTHRFPLFTETGGLIWKKNLQEENAICVPRNREIITQILMDAHEILGHFGDQRTCEYIRRWYWWPTIVKDTRTFCQTCEKCQRAKVSNQKPTGKLHPLPIPSKPWDSIGMDFIGPFPIHIGKLQCKVLTFHRTDTL